MAVFPLVLSEVPVLPTCRRCCAPLTGHLRVYAREVSIAGHLPGAAAPLSGRMDFVVVTAQPAPAGGYDVEMRIVEVKSAPAAHVDHMAQVV